MGRMGWVEAPSSSSTLPASIHAPPPNTHQKALCVHARWPCWPQLLGPRCFQNTWSMKGSEGMFCLKWLNPALSYNTICSEIDSLKMGVQGTSPMVQWLGVCLPMQGKRVRSLVLEDPTFCAAAKPVSCSRWAGALQPEARSKRGRHNEKPSHRSSDTAQPVLKKKKECPRRVRKWERLWPRQPGLQRPQPGPAWPRMGLSLLQRTLGHASQGWIASAAHSVFSVEALSSTFNWASGELFWCVRANKSCFE